MAAATGLSHTTIRRIWTALGLQPHRSETFKPSTDPLSVDKVQDIVGLYTAAAEPGHIGLNTKICDKRRKSVHSASPATMALASR